ncbi:MAG: T9SS type A sorting domain-containing protein [Bacteroidia bacterium]|nr:T9SS type A sorting domain-containing protein [Bacteroidia bacterium]
MRSQVTLSLNYQEKNGLGSIQSGDIYTMQLNYSVSSTTGNATGVKIEIPVPDAVYSVSNFAGTAHAPVSNFVFNNTPGSKKLTINFISPLASGSNGVLEFEVRVWNLITPNNTIVTTTAEMTASGGYTSGLKNHSMTVTAVPRICAQKTLLGGGAIDNITTYRILIKTGGYSYSAPLGTLQATNIVLTDTLPAGTQFVSANIYNASGTLVGTGTHSGGLVSANIPDLSYFSGIWSAQMYWVDIAVQYNSSTFSPGNIVRNIATVQYTPFSGTQDILYHGENIGGTCLTDLEEITTLAAPVVNGNLTISPSCGNVYPNNTFTYQIGFQNTGNVALNNLEIIDSIPANIRINQSNAYRGVRWDAMSFLNHVEYQTNLSGNTWVSHTYTNGFDVVPLLGPGVYFTKLKFVLNSPFPANTSLNGYNILTFSPAYEPVNPETVNNCFYWNSSTAGIPSLSARTICNTCVTLQPRPTTSRILFNVGNSPSCYNNLSIGQDITFSGTYTSDPGYSNAQQPVCMMLIPHGYQFVSNNFTVSTSGLPAPALQIIPNYFTRAGVIKDLYRWTFPANTIMPYGTNFTVSATVRVTGGLTPGVNYITDFTATAANASAHQPDNIWAGGIVDPNDWDSDANLTENHPITTNDYCCYTCRVSPSASMESRKWVRGELDNMYSRFPDYGYTVSGGNADYKLIVKNTGNIPMNSIQIIDILPFVGDVGVIDPSPRNTEWRPNLAGPIAAPAGITVYYSTVSNPCRDEVKQPTDPSPFPGGCSVPGWSVTPPLDITTVQSVKLDFGTSTLSGGDSLLFYWPMRAPVDAPVNNEIAWNSFGFTANRTDNNTPLIPAEPIKVGIRVQAPSPGMYGDRVWMDTDQDGVQDPGENGVSGVIVDLFRDNGDGIPDINVDTRVDFTITDDNGNYLFPNLPEGNYYAHFILPLGYQASPSNSAGNNALDSDGEITVVTRIDELEDDRTWDLGIYPSTACDLEIYQYTVSECVYTSGSSQATVNAFIAWNNPPSGQLINVSVTGAVSQTINPATASSPQLVSFQIPADGLEHTLSAAFASGCASGASTYRFFAPAPCLPGVCSLMITDVKTSLCMLDSTTGHALVDVFLEWSNEPFGEDIIVTVAGQTDTVKVSNGVFSPVLLTFQVPSDGTTGNLIEAAFESGTCSDTDSYDAPQPCSPGSVGNYVWNDVNGNGLQDEPAANGINGVSVELWFAGANGIIGGGDDVFVLDTVTADNGGNPGYYQFSISTSGNYYIKFPATHPGNILSTQNPAAATDGNSDADLNGYSPVFTINNSGTGAAKYNSTIDAGFYHPPLEIGNYLWIDSNKDGIQNNGETGLQGVELRLYNSNGNLIGVTATNAAGEYYFNHDNVDTTGVNTSGVPNNGFTGMTPNEHYYILAGLNGQFDRVNKSLHIGTAIYALTQANQGTGVGQDLTDSDAVHSLITDPTFSDYPLMYFNAGPWGTINHSYDMGFVPTTPEIYTSVQVSDCYDSNGNTAGGISQVEVRVVVDWRYNQPGEAIVVSVPGAASQTIALSSAAHPLVLTFVVPVTTPVSGMVTAVYTVSGNSATPVALNLAASNCILTPCESGSTGGVVYHDLNDNGIRDVSETAGVEGVMVTAFWDTGVTTGTVTTPTDYQGQFTFTAVQIPLTAKVRLEFTGFPSGLIPSLQGANNGTAVQFVNANTCTASLGLTYPGEYCQEDPQLVLAQNFRVDAPGVSSSAPGLLSTFYSWGSNSSTDSSTYATPNTFPVSVNATDIGSVWGVAYDRTHENIFVSATVKASSVLGTLSGGSTGAIYKVDNSGNQGNGNDITSASVFMDLNSPAYFNGAFGVPQSTYVYYSAQAFENVTKGGMGDLEISDDNRTLFTINLNDRQLYEIPLMPDGSAPPASSIIITPMPASLCAATDTLRPFALSFHEGKLYIGAVCAAENTQDISNLTANVLEYIPGSNVISATPVLSFPLNYERGSLTGSLPTLKADWNPWINVWDRNKIELQYDAYFSVALQPVIPGLDSLFNAGYAQPILADIEFDRGDMILSFVDRFGEQVNPILYPPAAPGDSLVVITVPGGDILRAGSNPDGTWSIENNATVIGTKTGVNTTTGANTNQGPGLVKGMGGEFYHQDSYFWGTSTPQTHGHDETNMGGLLVLPHDTLVVTAAYDNVRPILSGVTGSTGLSYFSNNSGNWVKGYVTQEPNYLPSNTYSKGNGIGDIEALCNAAPAEIGNYVWVDTDKDGVQDPGESGLSGIQVGLFDCNGTLVGLSTTNTKGEYYFNQSNVANQGVSLATGAPVSGDFSGLAYNSCYNVIFGLNGQFDPVTKNLVLGSLGYILTRDNTGQGSYADMNDSDASIAAGFTAGAAVLNGMPYIPVTTGGAGSVNHTYDIGFSIVASIGDFVWLDSNQNGIQDNAESGVAGISVTLSDTLGNVLASTITDATGYYIFTGLPADYYTVTFRLPVDYVFTAKGSGNASDSDADPVTGNSGFVLVTDGVYRLDVDAGIIYTSSSTTAELGDFVWYDENGNGTQDASEKGVSNVLVTLYNGSGSVMRNTLTDGAGFYLFNNLNAGNYQVGFSLPAGYAFTSFSGGGNNDSDVNTSGTNAGKTGAITLSSGQSDLNWDAGIILLSDTLASVGNYVWQDINQDGIQDAAENGVPGVTVTLSDKLDNIIASTVTNAYGEYLFTGLTAGEYYLSFTNLPSGWQVSPQGATTDTENDSDIDASGTTAVFYVDGGDNNMSIDAGIYNPLSQNAGLGDRVWMDVNSNGIQDNGEYGVAGVTVNLWNAAGTVLLHTTMTDGNGNYRFLGLDAGNYRVSFENIPSEYTITQNDLGGNDAQDSDPFVSTAKTGVINILANTYDPTVDAGLIATSSEAGNGSIGDYVWNDLNHNGIQDTGEPGIAGVRISLVNISTATVLTTETNATGYYLFNNLEAGLYELSFGLLPSGYVFTNANAGANDNLDSDTDGTGSVMVTIDAGESNLSIDAGAYNPTVLGALGNFVWYDINQNGLQDNGESGVAGVAVTLLNGSGVVLKTTTTNSSGYYLFTDLDESDYIVRFSNIPAGYVFTQPGQGGNNNTDSDAIPSMDGTTATTAAEFLATGQTRPDIDAGIYSTNQAGLGNYVWNDLNRNGIQDSNEPGVWGVTVTVYDNSGTDIANAITDANGWYLFPNLDPGDYSVGFSTLPAGALFTTANQGGNINTDSDVNPLTGNTDVITLNPGDLNLSLDAGIIALPEASLYGYVWYDYQPGMVLSTNVDGIQTNGEKPVSGVTAGLYDTGNQLLAITVTGSDGMYHFSNLAAGTYEIRFLTLPAGSSFTVQNRGGDDSTDSDADPANGNGGQYTIAAGEQKEAADAGLTPSAALTGIAFIDGILNVPNTADGIFDSSTEPILADVNILLLDASGNILKRGKTTDDGSYIFRNLEPGVSYRVAFEQYPGGCPLCEFTLYNSDTQNDSTDSDVNTTMITSYGNLIYGLTDIINPLQYNELKRNIDAGYARAGSAFPVELLGFTAIMDQADGLLRWSTTNEVNSSHFAVERSLDNGQTFEGIGSVAAAGNSDDVLSYQYRDVGVVQIAKDKIHYRLKMVDIDNTYKYSNTVALKLAPEEIYLNTYPSPAQDYLNVEYQLFKTGFAQLNVYNGVGQVVYSQTVMNEENLPDQKLVLDVRSWATGVYYLEIASESKIITQKFIVE